MIEFDEDDIDIWGVTEGVYVLGSLASQACHDSKYSKKGWNLAIMCCLLSWSDSKYLIHPILACLVLVTSNLKKSLYLFISLH